MFHPKMFGLLLTLFQAPNWSTPSSHKEVFENSAKSLDIQNPVDWYKVNRETLDSQTGLKIILEKYYGNSLYKVHSILVLLTHRLLLLSSQILVSFLGCLMRAYPKISGRTQLPIGRLTLLIKHEKHIL